VGHIFRGKGGTPPLPPREHRHADYEASAPGLTTVGTDDTGTTLTIHHVASGTTAATAPTTSSSSHRGNKHMVNSALTSGGSCKAIVGMVALGLLLSSLGAGLWGFLTIPGLYQQIEELEVQVDRLALQVDRLEEQVNDLEIQIDLLQVVNEDLNTTAQLLNVTAGQLQDQVDQLDILNDELARENDRYQELNNDLQASNEDLNGLVDELNTTVADINRANADLQTVASFLNETSWDLSDTVEGLASFLAEQIVAHRKILLETLENTFTGQLSHWDCALMDIFRIEDSEAPFGNLSLAPVLDYVEGRILDKFCLSRDDFDEFLDSTYGLSRLTAVDLQQGVAVYTTAALQYYFPDPDEESEGLSQQDWAEADYDCWNIPQKFRMNSM
jgi:prefoldin subunit 5